MIQGAKEFQRKGLNIGDIRTKNILITKNEEVKMVNKATSPNEKTAIEKILESFDQMTVFFLGKINF